VRRRLSCPLSLSLSLSLFDKEGKKRTVLQENKNICSCKPRKYSPVSFFSLRKKGENPYPGAQRERELDA
jgi:hypothetical protein